MAHFVSRSAFQKTLCVPHFNLLFPMVPAMMIGLVTESVREVAFDKSEDCRRHFEARFVDPIDCRGHVDDYVTRSVIDGRWSCFDKSATFISNLAGCTDIIIPCS